MLVIGIIATHALVYFWGYTWQGEALSYRSKLYHDNLVNSLELGRYFSRATQTKFDAKYQNAAYSYALHTLLMMSPDEMHYQELKQLVFNLYQIANPIIQAHLELDEHVAAQDILSGFVVLKNVSSSNVKLSKRVGSDLVGSKRGFKIFLSPNRWISELQQATDSKDYFEILNPGDSLKLKVQFGYLSKGKWTLFGQYRVSQSFAEKYNVWHGVINTPPLHITIP